MADIHTLARETVGGFLEKAAAENVPADVAGRALITWLIEAYKEQGRNGPDVQEELRFLADNISFESEDYTFMRP
jgi:hypothetical protein